MHYTYKKLKDFSMRLSRELGLSMNVCRDGKSHRYNLSESLFDDDFAWADINLCIYDRKLQQLHLSREIFGGGDYYAISDFNKQTQDMIRQARRRDEPVVWVECAVRTMRHKRYDACFTIERGSQWHPNDGDFEFIKKWFTERRAKAIAAAKQPQDNTAPTDDDINELPF